MNIYKYNYTPPGASFTTVIEVEADTLAHADAHAAAYIPAGFGGTLSTGVLYSVAALSNVDNTSDASKPVSTAQAAALALKAPLASPALTGTPTVPTASPLTNNTQAASTAYADAAVAVEVAARTSADAATLASANAHSDALVIGLWDDRGNFDASGGAYPSTGGSGPAGAILKGDIYTVSVAGTLPTGQVVEIGDSVRAKIDTPGNTQANWAILQNNIGYVPENVVNKDATGGYAGLTLFKINFKNALNTFTSFFTNANTAARTYTFQDRNGTIADDTDITSAKARANHTGTQLAATISDFAATVLGTVLTGLSLATNQAVAATDNILQAIGYLQKQITDLIASDALKAPLASPTFTGTPAAPTASPGTSTTQLATTAFVQASVGAKISATIDGTLQTTGIDIHSYNLTTSGGNGEVSAFLTSNGLTKTGGNTFLFSELVAHGGSSRVIASDAETDFLSGFDDSAIATTGLVRWKFSESNTVTLGGEGLEDTENGTSVRVWVIGIK